MPLSLWDFQRVAGIRLRLNALKQARELSSKKPHDMNLLAACAQLRHQINENAEDDERRLLDIIGMTPLNGADFWVDVEDRLPDNDGRYLVTLYDGGRRYVSTRTFKGSGHGLYKSEKPEYGISVREWRKTHSGSPWSRNTKGVVAWAELPRPYQ